MYENSNHSLYSQYTKSHKTYKYFLSVLEPTEKTIFVSCDNTVAYETIGKNSTKR